MEKTLDVVEILQKHAGHKRQALIPLLQDLQAHYGYLPREAILEAGKALGVPASKIYGVASFYNQFKFQQPGLHHIQACRGTACHVKGSLAVLEALKRALKIEPGQTTKDGLFSLEIVACVGACGLAPVICVNGEFFAGVTPEKVNDILDSFRKKV